MGITENIQRIRSAGFTLEVENHQLMVEPFSALSGAQIDWLRRNKPAILEALRQPGRMIEVDGGNDLPAANDQGNPITVEAFTPLGGRVLVRANSAEHADFIKRMNPAPGMVRCCDCAHASVQAGIASCGAGVESGLPIRGRWHSDRHPCESYQANA